MNAAPSLRYAAARAVGPAGHRPRVRARAASLIALALLPAAGGITGTAAAAGAGTALVIPAILPVPGF